MGKTNDMENGGWGTAMERTGMQAEKLQSEQSRDAWATREDCTFP